MTTVRILAPPWLLVLAIGCQSVVDTPEASRPGSSGTIDSSSTSDLEPGTSSAETTVDSASPDPSSTSEGTSDASATTDTSAESSSTGDSTQCPSPLVDDEDRLQLIGAPMRGNPDGLITIVQWSSPRCSYCRTAEQTLATLMKGRLGYEIRVIAKQLPLKNDPQRVLARSEMAAHVLGSFWEFHDAMYASDEDLLDPLTVDSIASSVGLDLDEFHAARDSDDVAARVAADIALSDALGNEAIPYFIINGAAIVGAQARAVFEAEAQAQLQAIETLIVAGVPPCVAFGERLEEQLP